MIHLARVRSKPSAWARCLALTLVALPLTTIAAARAQEVVATPNPDADRLADVVRRLGSAPRDLPALIEAGELSFTLGDATAAAAFYKRAEAIDPNNGRVKAGIARILVNGERPGEALRFFEQAQRHGATMARYADDRGLAYDLIGEQERAQQDYRLALSQVGRDAAELDEIRRRYALSLGISGKQDEALAQIDALLRHSDRGAWRARAFILAMNGDVAGANKIAGSMMPRGMAGGLAAFFQRLPSLSPADRAFAVHFGEVTPTAARLADARAVPPLAPLVVPARVQVAAAPTVQPAPTPQRLSRSEQRRRDRAARAAAAAPRTAVASATPVVSAATPAPAPTQLAQAAPIPAVPRDLTPTTTQPAFGTAPTRMAQASPVPAVPRDPGSTTTQPGFAAAPTRMVQASPAPVSPVAATRAPPVQMVQALPTPTPAPAPTQLAAVVTTAPVPRPARHIAAPPARAIPPRISEDSILARIVAGISVPAAELGVAPMPGGQRVPLVAAPPAPVAATLDEAARTAERNAAADEQKRPRLAAAKRVAQKSPVVVEEEAKPLDRKVRGKAVAAKKDGDEAEETLAAKPLDRKARGKALTGKKDVAAADDDPAAKPLDRKARAKALAAEKAKKDAAAKELAEKKAARAEPERIWVQIASGANAADLPKAWKGAQDKADALGGKRAYTVQNRATNRLVTGPFKTEAEARAMVNTLKKQGLSAFSFTSDAGQKMTRLGGK